MCLRIHTCILMNHLTVQLRLTQCCQLNSTPLAAASLTVLAELYQDRGRRLVSSVSAWYSTAGEIPAFFPFIRLSIYPWHRLTDSSFSVVCISVLYLRNWVHKLSQIWPLRTLSSWVLYLCDLPSSFFLKQSHPTD